MTVDIQALKASPTYAEEAFVVDAQAFLHDMMEAKGMSRSDLAAAMGVSRARVTQLFSSDCKNFTVRLLARAFFAMGEVPELTCEHHRKQQRRSDRRILIPDGWSSSGKYSFENGGATNDNGLAAALRFGEVEVGSAPNDRRVNELVSTLGRALLRERVA